MSRSIKLPPIHTARGRASFSTSQKRVIAFNRERHAVRRPSPASSEPTYRGPCRMGPGGPERRRHVAHVRLPAFRGQAVQQAKVINQIQIGRTGTTIGADGDVDARGQHVAPAVRRVAEVGVRARAVDDAGLPPARWQPAGPSRHRRSSSRGPGARRGGRAGRVNASGGSGRRRTGAPQNPRRRGIPTTRAAGRHVPEEKSLHQPFRPGESRAADAGPRPPQDIGGSPRARPSRGHAGERRRRRRGALLCEISAARREPLVQQLAALPPSRSPRRN